MAASRANFNTEIGLPLEVLAAPPGTEVLVLELAMRGFGQIAELTAICEPDVGVITNIGPVHLEQMGSLEGVARGEGGAARRDARRRRRRWSRRDEPLLEPYLRDALDVVTFGPGGDVSFEGSSLRGGTVPDAPPDRHVVIARGERIELELPFDSRHNLRNTLAAVAAARAVGVRPGGRVDVRFSALRGERVALGRGATVVNDCYNANPLSMRAALDDLAMQQPAGRRVAVLGDMLELGPAEAEHHREIGAYAATAGVDVLIAVGPRSRAMLERFDGEALRRGRRGGGGRAGRPAGAGRRRRAGQGLARRRARGRRRGARRLRGRRLMGEVLIGGTASLLICIFLSPKFIAFLRRREFGQQIREEGPQEHHAKAGTPTMGGLIIFTAIAVPFLMLTDFDPRAVGVLGVALACAALGFADDYMKLIKKRSLGLQGRWKLIITMGDRDRAVARGDGVGGPVGQARPARDRRDDRPRDPLPGPDLPRRGGDDVGGEPDGRARRPGRRAARRSCCSPTSRSRSRRGRPTSRSSPRAWSARASASSGSTRSRRRSSWATRGRSGSGARSRRSR